jgi:arsenate reductase
MTDRVLNVLFLCTGNSARSILAECILNRLGGGRFAAHSAGSHPRGAVNPDALALLRDLGYATDGLRSKSWDEFARADAPAFDLIFTVCDDAAGEICPVWPGRPVTAHWGMPDPAAVARTAAERRRAFDETYQRLHDLLLQLVTLPIAELDRASLRQRLDEIGRGARA